MIGLFTRCALAALFILSAQQVMAGTAPVPLRVIASVVPHAEILRFAQTLAPDLSLKIIEIDSAVRPNELLARGEADANFFQHVPYLRQQEKDLGTQFAVVAAVHIEPLGIYSRKIRSLAALHEHLLVLWRRYVQETGVIETPLSIFDTNPDVWGSLNTSRGSR
jgi:D-methionine transport system substrate-binding protein